MNSYTLLQALLTLHLTGLILMAGTIVTDALMYRSFWHQYPLDQKGSLHLLMASGKLARIAAVGAALLILTGFAMMIVTKGVFGEQLWFRVKFGLVILLIVINLVARRRSKKLSKVITQSDATSLREVAKQRLFLQRYFGTAFVIFFVIILLSVFKFN